MNDDQINTLHISACDSDTFEKNQNYEGLVLWHHKKYGQRYDLANKTVWAGQIIIKKTKRLNQFPGITTNEAKKFHVSFFKELFIIDRYVVYF